MYQNYLFIQIKFFSRDPINILDNYSKDSNIMDFVRNIFDLSKYYSVELFLLILLAFIF